MIVVLVASSASDPGSDAATGISRVMAGIGLLFLVMAARLWRKRPKPGEAAAMPSWMASINGISPMRAIGLGIALSAANPKNLALTLAASATIAGLLQPRAGREMGATGAWADGHSRFVAVTVTAPAAPRLAAVAKRCRQRITHSTPYVRRGSHSVGGGAIRSGGVSETGARRPWWVVVAAIVIVGAVGVMLVIALRGDDDAEPVGGVPVTSLVVPTTSAPPRETPGTAAPTPPSSDAAAPSATGLAGRTSPLEQYAACIGQSCPTVQYAADGLPVAYDAAAKTVTVLEASPRIVSLDIPESQGRLITVGPDQVAYLLVESPGVTNPGRIVAVPIGSKEAGTVHEVVGSTDGLGHVFVAPSADAIEVVDCCGIGAEDGSYPYVDASGAELAGDPSLATWSWEWPLDGAVVVRNNKTGESFDVPQAQAESEGLRSGDLRPLVNERVVMLVNDGTGATTAWVLDPDNGTWTSTELGDALVEAIDPAGAVLTRDPSTLAFDLVALD